MRKIHIILFLIICQALSAQENLSLQDCLDMGDRANPYVRNAELDILSAKARKSELGWEYFPTASLGMLGYYAVNPIISITPQDVLGTSEFARDISRAYTDFASATGLPASIDALHRGYGFSLMATQPLYAGGRIVNGNRLASIGVEAAELQSDIKLRDTRDDIESKYWLALSLQEKMITLEKAESVLDSIYRYVLSARKAGLVVESDVSQVSRKRAELAAGKVRLRSGLKLAKMDLFNAIGLEYEYLKLDDYVLSESVRDTDMSGIAVSPDAGVTAESRLLEIKEQAARLEKKVYVGEYLPQVGLGFTLGYGNLQGFSTSNMNGIGFFTVKVPLTGIGKAVSRARRYDYEIEKARNEREYLGKQLELQRHQLFLAVETARSQAEVSLQAMKDAESSHTRCLADYKAGRIPVSDLLAAELECRTAAEQYIDDCIEYRKAVGVYNRRYSSE